VRAGALLWPPAQLTWHAEKVRMPAALWPKKESNVMTFAWSPDELKLCGLSLNRKHVQVDTGDEGGRWPVSAPAWMTS
jgi:hypothetical protein